MTKAVVVTDTQWDTYRYRVRSAAMVTPVIRELWLEPIGEVLPYRPGQYILFADDRYAVPQRSYSVANAPRADGRLSVLVTLVPGGRTSTWAHEISVYDEVSVEGPFGTFTTPDEATSPVLLLGAGSGLAPVRALAEALLDPSRPEGAAGRRVTLFFSGRTARDAIDRERFEEWCRNVPQFDYRLTCTRDAREQRHTRIPALLPGEFETRRGVEVFAAGPSGCVTACQAAAEPLGAATVDIRTEEFFTDPAPWYDTVPPIESAYGARAPMQEGSS